MNKAIIVGIIAIIIGIAALAFSQSNTEESIGTTEESIGTTEEVSIIEDIENKPKQFTVGLTEDVGIKESP